MCGLTGFLAGGPNPPDRARMRAIGTDMADAICHRGPDAAGIWQDDEAPLVLAHRRLAIIDLSDEGRQPMVSSSGRYVLIYNGEIYNYLGLRAELESAGIAFHGRSDTEVLLESIEARGLNLTLQKINGMFAFVLWDRKSRILHFARDRFGKKPLYVGWAGKSLVFGSELKALRRYPNFKATINQEALGHYKARGYVAAPLSIYQGVWTLPPGHRLSLPTENLMAGEDLSGLMEPYWNALENLELAKRRTAPESDGAAIEEFEEILNACVKERMISDVPLGAFLSGGIDSSSVVALMQKHSSAPIKTYTIGFHESGFDEASHAKKIAERLGTDHHELYLSAGEALDVIPKLPEIYDEPFADISAIPTYLVSQFARRDVTVALSGDGGDEMLGGYTRYVAGPALWERMRWMPGFARKGLARMIRNVSVARWDSMSSRPQLGAGMHKAASILALNSEEEIHARLTRHDGEKFSPQENFYSSAAWRAKDLSFAEKMMYWDVLSWLPNDILVKLDRASMAASLEARAPLLDRRVFDYVWSLPMEMRIRGGKGKWILREILKKHVPLEMFERPKQGFNMPVGDWLRGPLKDWASDLLPKADDAPDAAKINALWAAHLKGEGNHANALWTELMFQAWQRRWG